MGLLSSTLTSLGRYPEADLLDEELYNVLRNTLGADHPKTVESMVNLAVSSVAVGRMDLALQLADGAVAWYRKRGDTSSVQAVEAMSNLAGIEVALGRYDKALVLDELVYASQHKRLGAQALDTLVSMVALANDYAELGRASDAVRMAERAKPLLQTRLGTDHLEFVRNQRTLAKA